MLLISKKNLILRLKLEKTKMRKYLFLLLSAFMFLKVSAQSDTNDLKISVLTCARGQMIYESFGHCAFRVQGDSGRIDRVYNYGTFKFNTPFFVIKFVRGFLDYYLSAYDYRRFFLEYKHDGRDVYEQVLDLSAEDRQAVFDYLEWNALEQNRYYKYNFLEDNCATRIRDCIEKVCGNSVVFPNGKYDFTLRESINNRLVDMPWYRLGVNILMGLPVDRIADSRSAMFLPDYIFTILNETYLVSDGEKKKIVGQSNPLLKFETPVNRTDFTTHCSPALVFWILFVVWAMITIIEIKSGKVHRFCDSLLLFLSGLLGVVFIFMWFFTEHTVTAWNLNLLWALPSHLVAAFMTRSKKLFWQKYFIIASVFTLIVLISTPILPQHFDVGVYPIMCMLIMCMARLVFFRR